MGSSQQVRGHGLVAEGAPFEGSVDQWGRIVAQRLNAGGVSGEGKALCSCNEMSEVLPSGGARKQWHREHKDQVKPT